MRINSFSVSHHRLNLCLSLVFYSTETFCVKCPVFSTCCCAASTNINQNQDEKKNVRVLRILAKGQKAQSTSIEKGADKMLSVAKIR